MEPSTLTELMAPAADSPASAARPCLALLEGHEVFVSETAPRPLFVDGVNANFAEALCELTRRRPAVLTARGDRVVRHSRPLPVRNTGHDWLEPGQLVAVVPPLCLRPGLPTFRGECLLATVDADRFRREFAELAGWLRVVGEARRTVQENAPAVLDSPRFWTVLAAQLEEAMSGNDLWRGLAAAAPLPALFRVCERHWARHLGLEAASGAEALPFLHREPFVTSAQVLQDLRGALDVAPVDAAALNGLAARQGDAGETQLRDIVAARARQHGSLALLAAYCKPFEPVVAGKVASASTRRVPPGGLMDVLLFDC